MSESLLYASETPNKSWPQICLLVIVWNSLMTLVEPQKQKGHWHLMLCFI